MPTIRVDDEVWGWLQSKACPFDDTPNSALRRFAGLDGGREPPAVPPSRTEEAQAVNPPKRSIRPQVGRRITGESLNRKFYLGAKHALYHKDGTFYERLSGFPAVYCDTRGFVRFQSQDQFDRDPHLSIGQKVNIPGGLSSHPRFERFPAG